MATMTIRPEGRRDVAAREDLLDAAFGDARFVKTAERLREGRLAAKGLSFVARNGAGLIGTVRLWDISAGPNCPALLLGPLAVASHARNHGVGAALTQHALRAAREAGHAAVLLVGDAPYYGRFGFSADKTGTLWLPGPYERERLLACELVPGALDCARGLVSATGWPVPHVEPNLAALVASLVRNDNTRAPRAA
jgi:predicted N-acetyltransferase YhbS